MGRKSLKDEYQILNRYANLSVPAFKFLEKCLSGKNKADKRWAVEQLNKGFAKMIPTQLTGEGGGPVQVSWKSQLTTSPAGGQKSSTTQ